MKSIAFFQFSTEEDLSFVLEFSGLVLTGRDFEIKVTERSSNTTKVTLTNGSGITISGTNVLEAAYAKVGMAGWARGEYSADVVDVTGGGHSRIMAVRFVYDLPGRLVQGVQNRKAFVQWSPNQAVVTATGAIGPAGPVGLTGPRGEAGLDGTDGADGDKGWAPAFAIVSDGARRVLQVDDWVGGEGTKPATGDYVGASGLTPTIGDAIDIRGPVGGPVGPGTITDDEVSASAGIVATKLNYIRDTSGPATRTVSDKLSEIVDVRDWSLWSGTDADRGAALLAAAAEVASQGGGAVRIPPGSFGIATPVVVNESFVRFKGAGCSTNHDYVSQEWATRLGWTGSAGATMFSFAPISSITSKALTGWGLEDIFLDGGNLAYRGLDLRSVRAGVARGVFFTKFHEYALYTDVVADLGPGEARDTMRNTFENLTFRQIYDATPASGEGNGSPIFLGGDSAANTCYNRFEDIDALHTEQHGILLSNADRNVFDVTRIHRPVGSGNSLVFGAGSTALLTARSNEFRHLFAQGGVYAQGTEVAAAPSYNNFIEQYDTENGSPDPTIGAGASLEWGDEYAAKMVLVGDEARTIDRTERLVGTSTAFTAARAWTLPAASSLTAGAAIDIVDQAGAVSAANTLTITRAGSDTINDGTTFVVNTPRRILRVVTDGISKWSVSADPTWLAYTPTVTPGAGTYTTVTATGRYYTVGKLTHFSAAITFTDIGTGATSVTVSLPLAAGASAVGMVAGQETASSGLFVQGNIANSGTSCALRRYDATPFVPANGNALTLSGTYESA